MEVNLEKYLHSITSGSTEAINELKNELTPHMVEVAKLFVLDAIYLELRLARESNNG